MAITPPPPPPGIPERRRVWQVNDVYVRALVIIVVLGVLTAILELVRVLVKINTGTDDTILTTLATGSLALFSGAITLASGAILRSLTGSRNNGDTGDGN